jgi:hypothetical protein
VLFNSVVHALSTCKFIDIILVYIVFAKRAQGIRHIELVRQHVRIGKVLSVHFGIKRRRFWKVVITHLLGNLGPPAEIGVVR